jgi:FKBP-type peptidyl-prolyl cis-trans isomerase FkpA
MKRLLFPVLVSFFFLACNKSSSSSACQDVSPESEETQILAYCGANGIDYTKDSSGIYYQIIDPGTDPKPTVNSIVSTIYVGKYLNGTVIDQSTTPYTNELDKLVLGWQIGLPLIGKGGHIKMVVPSSLCYGCYGVPAAGVPPNTIIYFDVTLVDVK